MTQIPMLDRRFCLELFGDTINTTAGLAQEGFVIRKQIGQPPYKTVIINPQRLQITTMNPIETAQVYLKVIEEINRISGGTIPLFFSGIGLNTEQEIFGFSDETSKGLTDRFIIEGINADENGKKPIARTLNITIEWTIGDDNKLNIVLQPRIGIPNCLFVVANDHRLWTSISLPGEKDIEKLFEDSLENLKKKIFKSLLE